jgi:probable HAF family extracellular repeat protein
MQGLGTLPGGNNYSIANGVSADGHFVVGRSKTANGQEAFIWDNINEMQGLGDLPGGTNWSEATSISADGHVVVGSSSSANDFASGGEAFIWDKVYGMRGLGDLLPEGSTTMGSHATDVSSDGLIVVGYSYSNYAYGLTYEAFLWNNVDGMRGLGFLHDGATGTYAYGVSGDGHTIVGRSTYDFVTEAFIWKEANGMRSIKEVLINDYGLDLNGWLLEVATDISTDGMTIVGYGTNPDGITEAWIAILNPLATTDSDTDGAPNNLDNCPCKANIDQIDSDNDGIGDTCTAHYFEGDFDKDCDVDADDLNTFTKKFGSIGSP